MRLGLRTNWTFAGNATITAENSSVETTWSGNGNSLRFVVHGDLLQASLPQTLSSWFHSNFISVHVDKPKRI